MNVLFSKTFAIIIKKIRRAAYCIPLKHIGNKKSTFTLFFILFLFFIVSEENVGIISKISL